MNRYNLIFQRNTKRLAIASRTLRDLMFWYGIPMPLIQLLELCVLFLNSFSCDWATFIFLDSPATHSQSLIAATDIKHYTTKKYHKCERVEIILRSFMWHLFANFVFFVKEAKNTHTTQQTKGLTQFDIQ